MFNFDPRGVERVELGVFCWKNVNIGMLFTITDRCFITSLEDWILLRSFACTLFTNEAGVSLELLEPWAGFVRFDLSLVDFLEAVLGGEEEKKKKKKKKKN